jgi:peptide methionine sulfoxide reductase MsrA
VVSTRVGYAGGTSLDPTYHDLENHSESIEITYDPAVISYEELLDVF